MSQPTQRVPGVHREVVREAQDLLFRTGVPAFLGDSSATAPVLLTRAAQFASAVPGASADGPLAAAVRGFFAAGGRRCFVIPVPPGAGAAGHRDALVSLGELAEVDLVAAPDLLAAWTSQSGPTSPSAAACSELVATQAELVRRAAEHRCVSVLDLPPTRAQASRHAAALRTALIKLAGPAALRDAALYHPWVRAPGEARFQPPSGHVLGLIANLDEREGVHRAPAGLELAGICDLGDAVDDAAQPTLDELGVNCIRAFRGRGLRVWGAHTLTPDGEWRPLSVRRLILTIGRWLELRLTDFAFEPNDPLVWNRLAREVSGYLDRLHAAGALRGRIPAEAYFIKCDAETNPPEVRDAGQLIAEIGVAPLVPQAFIALRLIQRSGGTSLTDAAG
jgi:phage tail sheath protein FI